MRIHEYQAKEIFKEYGIPVPRGKMVREAQDVKRFAKEIGSKRIVVKAQIHAGGRGKGGGIKIVDSPEDAEAAANEILNKILITNQTGQEGRVVKKVLVEEAVEIIEELYLGIVIDRSRACPLIIATGEGGVDIEKLASESPEKMIMEWVDPLIGLRDFHVNKISYKLNLPQPQMEKMRRIIKSLYRIFYEKDCLLVEINPLAKTRDGEFVAIDAKINFDDNGLFRHRDIASLRDPEEESPLEVEASKYNLSYIKLNGNVGCMVNGAGLAMATMDMIKFLGKEPANFLDVGGGASVEMVKNGFKILTADKDVKVVFINIFGGIMRCDTIARGVIEALSETKIQLPIVIRLEGTNVEEGRRLLKESGLNFTIAQTMEEGAKKVVEMLRKFEDRRN